MGHINLKVLKFVQLNPSYLDTKINTHVHVCLAVLQINRCNRMFPVSLVHGSYMRPYIFLVYSSDIYIYKYVYIYILYMVLQVHVDIQNPPPGLIPFIQGNHRCPYLPSHRDQLTWKQQTTERVWVQTSWTPKLNIYIYT
jgi:hypothetical protein